MIRWSYVLPRLIVISLLGLATLLALDPLVRWSLISTGQTLTGAKVDVGQVKSSLRSARLEITGLNVASPTRAHRNLLTSQQIVLELDRWALLRRQFVVQRGLVRGVEVWGSRDTSGDLEASRFQFLRDAADGQLADAGRQWLTQVLDTLRQDFGDDLQSIQLAKDLMRRWPANYEQLRSRTEMLLEQASALRNKVEQAGGSTIERLDTFQQTALDLRNIQIELDVLRAEIERLGQQAQRDRSAVLAAQSHDQQVLRDKAQLARLDGDAIAQHLLGDKWCDTLSRIMRWVEWSSRVLPTDQLLPSERARGTMVAFGGPRQPEFLIRSLQIQGRGQVDDVPLEFLARVRDLAGSPRQYEKPVVIDLKIKAASELYAQLELDYRQQVQHQRLILVSPNFQLPATSFGDPELMALNIHPGTSYLKVMVDLRGEQVAGEVFLRQCQLQLQPVITSRLGDPQLESELCEVFGSIDHSDTRIELDGTWRELQWKLQSDIGEQVSSRLQQLVAVHLANRCSEVATLVETAVQRELQSFDQFVMQQQQTLLGKIQLDMREIARFQSKLANRVRVPDPLPGMLPVLR